MCLSCFRICAFSNIVAGMHHAPWLLIVLMSHVGFLVWQAGCKPITFQVSVYQTTYQNIVHPSMHWLKEQPADRRWRWWDMAIYLNESTSPLGRTQAAVKSVPQLVCVHLFSTSQCSLICAQFPPPVVSGWWCGFCVQYCGSGGTAGSAGSAVQLSDIYFDTAIDRNDRYYHPQETKLIWAGQPVFVSVHVVSWGTYDWIADAMPRYDFCALREQMLTWPSERGNHTRRRASGSSSKGPNTETKFLHRCEVHRCPFHTIHDLQRHSQVSVTL